MESCSRDPIGYEGTLFGLYGYGPSNPYSGMDPEGEIWFIPVIVIVGILVTPTLLGDPDVDGSTVGSQDDQLTDNAVNVVILVGGVAAARYCLKPCIDAVVKRRAIAEATRAL